MESCEFAGSMANTIHFTASTPPSRRSAAHLPCVRGGLGAVRRSYPEKSILPKEVHMEKEKTVTIRLPKNRSQQEDVFVSVNNRTWLIQRGVQVEAPLCVAEVLRHQEKMQETIMLFEKEKRND